MKTDIDIAPVSLASASKWLAGEFVCGDEVRRCPHLDLSRHEIIFSNVLGNRASYPAAMREVHRLWHLGCRGLVTHATGKMIRRWERQGGLIAMRESIVWRGETAFAARILLPADRLAAWIDKTARCLDPRGESKPL